MRRQPTKWTLLLTMSLLLIVALAGCSQESTAPGTATTGSDDYESLDFSAAFGGLTASDEAEAFGDKDLLAMSLLEEGEEVADPVADDPEVRDLEAQGHRAWDGVEGDRPHFTFVHLRWGMLRSMMDSVRAEAPCEVADWTGAINVDRGKLLVRRAIRFERPQDHIILPRLNHQTIGLVSHTACGFDGLVLQIIERPQEYAEADSVDHEPNMLHINIGGFSVDLPVADLAGMSEVWPVGDQGNNVALNGYKLRDLSVCPKGFLSGHFRKLRTDRPDSVRIDRPGEQYGVFAGMWRGLHGRIGGHLRGAYGVNDAGERVFFGKYIGPRGHFRGLVAGTWEPGDEDDLMASFIARWHSANGEAAGVLGGTAFAVEGTPGGFFVGRWAAQCDDESEDSIF
ncbi:MAG: hypothetical protein ACI9UK_001676 [Candidatus Krumholzibacteriia bacterium]|jgi:hypothetical protein